MNTKPSTYFLCASSLALHFTSSPPPPPPVSYVSQFNWLPHAQKVFFSERRKKNTPQRFTKNKKKNNNKKTTTPNVFFFLSVHCHACMTNWFHIYIWEGVTSVLTSAFYVWEYYSRSTYFTPCWQWPSHCKTKGFKRFIYKYEYISIYGRARIRLLDHHSYMYYNVDFFDYRNFRPESFNVCFFVHRSWIFTHLMSWYKLKKIFEWKKNPGIIDGYLLFSRDAGSLIEDRINSLFE